MRRRGVVEAAAAIDRPVDHTVHDCIPNPATRRLLPLYIALNRRRHDPKRCLGSDTFVSVSSNFHVGLATRPTGSSGGFAGHGRRPDSAVACTHLEHDRRGMPERHAWNPASKSVRVYTKDTRATGAHEAGKIGASRGVGTNARAKRQKLSSCAPVASASFVLQTCLSGRGPRHHQGFLAGGVRVRAD